MPLLLPVAVLLILGAVTLASRTTNSWMVATRQSDAMAARQAAESGMNRVVSALNPYAKYGDSTYISYLLISRWQPGVNGAAGTWQLIANGTTSAGMQTLLRTCGLSARGFYPTQLPPSSYANLLSGTIGITGTTTKLRYRIVNFVPPERPTDPSSMPQWPSQCNVFTSLAGGSAQITVEGTVERPMSGSSGDVVVARYLLTRNLDVQGWPFPDLDAEWFDGRRFPGPPVSLRIGNQGTGLGLLTSAVYKDSFATEALATDVNNTMGDFRPQCGLGKCDSAPTNGLTEIIPAGDKDLPRYYPFPGQNPPSGVNPLAIDENTSDLDNFPYTNPGNNPRLQDGCITSTEPTRPNEIDCWIASIAPGVNLTVNTSVSPVNLVIRGNVGGPDDAKPGLNAPAAQLQTNFVSLKHCVESCGPGNNAVYYDHRVINNSQPIYRNRWNRLRIFGNPPASSQNVCSVNQQFFIRADAMQNGPSLAGVFLWLPQGELNYGNRQDPGTGQAWVLNPTQTEYLPASPEPNPNPFEILTTWWVCNLNLRITAPLKFIMPLYGNPDAVSAFLPGSYLDASGTPVPDLRFPVYPLLPRIRTTY